MAYEDAAALYEEWHEFEPEGIIDIDIPVPEDNLEYLGLLKRLDYMSPKWEGDQVYYYHHFRQGWPRLYKDRHGNYHIFGNIRITPDGIDDWLKTQKFEWKKPSARKGVSKLGVLQLLAYEDAKTGKTKTQMFGDRYYVGNPSKDFTYIARPMRQNPRSKPIAVLQLENIVNGIRKDKQAVRVLERALANIPRRNPIEIPATIAAKAAEAAAKTATSQAFLKSIVTGVSTATFGVGMVATVLGSLLVNFVVGYIKNKVTPPTMPPPPKWVAKMTQSYMEAGVQDPKDITDRVQEIWNEQSFESKVGIYEGESGKEGEEGEDEPDVEEPDVSGETEAAENPEKKEYTKDELIQKALEMTFRWAYNGTIRLASDAWTFFKKKGIDIDFSKVRAAFADGKRKRHKDDRAKGGKGGKAGEDINIPYIANPKEQPKCPKCGGGGWLDISGKYVCHKCGNLFAVERDLYSSRFNCAENPLRSKSQYRLFKARYPEMFERWQKHYPVNYQDLPEKAENPLTYKDFKEAIEGEGWAIGDYAGMIAESDDEGQRKMLTHIRDEEKEHLDELVTLLECRKTHRPNPSAWTSPDGKFRVEQWGENDFTVVEILYTDPTARALGEDARVWPARFKTLKGAIRKASKLAGVTYSENPAETVLDRSRREGR